MAREMFKKIDESDSASIYMIGTEDMLMLGEMLPTAFGQRPVYTGLDSPVVRAFFIGLLCGQHGLCPSQIMTDDGLTFTRHPGADAACITVRKNL